MVLPNLVNYLAQSLLVHFVVLGHHLVLICIMHNKVVHVYASWFVDRGLNVGGAEVLGGASFVSPRWLLHMHICIRWLLFLLLT